MFVTNTFIFVIYGFTLIKNIKALVINALMFFMNELMWITKVKTLITNPLMFSMNELTLITKADGLELISCLGPIQILAIAARS